MEIIRVAVPYFLSGHDMSETLLVTKSLQLHSVAWEGRGSVVELGCVGKGCFQPDEVDMIDEGDVVVEKPIFKDIDDFGRIFRIRSIEFAGDWETI